MKSTRRLVHWLPLKDVLLPYFQYKPPTSVYDWYVEKYKGDQLPVELQCPAVRLLLQNTFVFYSPTFFRFKYDLKKAMEFYGYNNFDGPGKELIKNYVGMKNQEFIGPDSRLIEHGVVQCSQTDIPSLIRNIMPFHTLAKGVEDNYSAVFQLPVEILFVTDKPLWVELLPPYMHDDYYKMNITIIPGTFDFSNWVRNTSVSFKIRDFEKEIQIKRDDPLFYVRFYSNNPYDTVNLKLLDEKATGVTYEEIIKENQANLAVKSYAPNLSWAIIQNRFNGWKESMSSYMKKSNPFRFYK